MKRAARVRRQPHPCCCAAGAAAAQLPRASREVRRAASPQNYVLGPLCARRASRPCLVPRQGEAAPHPSLRLGRRVPRHLKIGRFSDIFRTSEKLLYTAYKVASKLRFEVDKNFVFIWRGIPPPWAQAHTFFIHKKSTFPRKVGARNQRRLWATPTALCMHKAPRATQRGENASHFLVGPGSPRARPGEARLRAFFYFVKKRKTLFFAEAFQASL